MLSRIFPDRFVPVLFATILLASLLPVRGSTVPIAQGLSTAAIIFLFFLNGVRLPRDEVLHGIRNWKLQGSAFAFCFGGMALLGLAAGEIHGEAVLRIVSILLVPFVAGQLAQRWLRPWVLAHRGLATLMDRTAIAIAVYVAFSAAVVAGIWSLLDAREIVVLLGAVAVLLALSFGGAWALGGMLGLTRPDRITLLFSGAQKSIAVGAPLAATLFPPAIAGMVLVPILVYHMAQLILSAWIAPALRAEEV